MEAEAEEAGAPLSKRRQKQRDFEAMMRRVEAKLEKATAPKSKGSVVGLGPMFRMLDRRGDGALELDRVAGMLRDHLKIEPGALSDDDIASFLRAVDERGTGAVNLADVGAFAAGEMRRWNPDARVIYEWRQRQAHNDRRRSVKAAVAEAATKKAA